MTTTIRTPAEIAELKQHWLQDPCWDIEDTEGFEAHRDELLNFRLLHRAMREEIELSRKTRRSSELAIPGNIALLDYLESLEERIRVLSKRLERLEERA